MEKNNALYVHIPFCSHMCHYCDFTKFSYVEKRIKPFLATLKQELDQIDTFSFKTVYVGGGTPTSLSIDQLEQLLIILKPYTNEIVEYTFEANVENTTREKLELLKRYGVNRLSFGVQSTCDKTLEYIGRKHSYQQAVEGLICAREVGFTNISVDLIYGLPGQSISELEEDINNIIKLDVPHISTYSLTVHKNTIAHLQGWKEIDDGSSRDMYDLILDKLQSVGYSRYEVSNFAKSGYQGIHNHVYWENREYYAIGYGASGYVNRVRYQNIGSFSKYLSGIIEKTTDPIDDKTFEFEYLMLNLRLKNGFSLVDFKRRTGNDFILKYKSAINKLVEYKLLIVDKDRVFTSDDGLIKLNYILTHLNEEK